MGKDHDGRNTGRGRASSPLPPTGDPHIDIHRGLPNTISTPTICRLGDADDTGERHPTPRLTTTTHDNSLQTPHQSIWVRLPLFRRKSTEMQRRTHHRHRHGIGPRQGFLVEACAGDGLTPVAPARLHKKGNGNAYCWGRRQCLLINPGGQKRRESMTPFTPDREGGAHPAPPGEHNPLYRPALDGKILACVI